MANTVEFTTRDELGEPVLLVRVVRDGRRGVWLRATPENVARCERRAS